MNEDDYITLIYRRLDGVINASDEAKLSAWLAVSEANRRTAASIEKAWQASANLSPHLDLDLDAEFESMTTKMDPPKAAKILNMQQWLTLAASLVVLIVAAIWILRPDEPTIEWVTLSTDLDQSQVSLPDGSIIYLNTHSSITYPSTFNGKIRNVQFEGEAFFDIQENPSQPFVIETSAEKITVLGTSFNVSTLQDSVATIVVATGRVQVEQLMNQASIVLKANESVISNRSRGELTKSTVNNLNQLSWHTRQLSFNSTDLRQVLDIIEALYTVKIDLTNEALLNCQFSGDFDHDSITTVLEVITTIYGAKTATISENQYQIQGGSCQ